MMYAIPMSDGSVAVMTTVGDAKPEDCIAKWSSEMRASVISIQKIDQAAVPVDRTFRNAWMLSGDKIDHDMTKAREIHRARMRQARAPLLAALDVEFIRADEAKDEAAKADVIARKTALRNVTADPAIEAAKTPEALKAVWPEILN